MNKRKFTLDCIIFPYDDDTQKYYTDFYSPEMSNNKLTKQEVDDFMKGASALVKTTIAFQMKSFICAFHFFFIGLYLALAWVCYRIFSLLFTTNIHINGGYVFMYFLLLLLSTCITSWTCIAITQCKMMSYMRQHNSNLRNLGLDWVSYDEYCTISLKNYSNYLKTDATELCFKRHLTLCLSTSIYLCTLIMLHIYAR